MSIENFDGNEQLNEREIAEKEGTLLQKTIDRNKLNEMGKMIFVDGITYMACNEGGIRRAMDIADDNKEGKVYYGEKIDELSDLTIEMDEYAIQEKIRNAGFPQSDYGC